MAVLAENESVLVFSMGTLYYMRGILSAASNFFCHLCEYVNFYF